MRQMIERVTVAVVRMKQKRQIRETRTSIEGASDEQIIQLVTPFHQRIDFADRLGIENTIDVSSEGLSVLRSIQRGRLSTLARQASFTKVIQEAIVTQWIDVT